VAAVVVALVAVWAGLRLFGEREFRQSNQPYFDKVDGIKVGMTKADVIRRMGQPDRKYTAANVPDDYYVEGYAFKRRKVDGEVLIYLGGMDLVAYIYVNRAGIVDDKFVGGS